MKKSKNIILVVGIIAIAIALAFFIKKSRDDKASSSNMTKVDIEDSSLIDTKEGQEEAPDKVEDKGQGAFYIESEDQYEDLIEQDKPLIMMFGTDVCVYCAQMRPYVEEISGLYQDQVNIKYVNAGELPNIAFKYPVKGVPALMIRNHDKTGFSPSQELFDELNDNYNSPTAYSYPSSDKHDFTMTYGLVSRDLTVKIVKELIDYAK